MIVYQPIGVIHSPFQEQEGMPIQPAGAREVPGWIEVNRTYEAGLKSLDGFSHIILLYHFHRSQGFDLEVIPFLDNAKRGVFATRAPRRPNSIGMSIVKLIGIEGNVLRIENVDVIDNTPLLDIKPYVSAFDAVADATSGWVRGKEKKIGAARADDRFNTSPAPNLDASIAKSETAGEMAIGGKIIK